MLTHASPPSISAELRHTNKWFTVYRGLTAADRLKEIEENEIFWPTA